MWAKDSALLVFSQGLTLVATSLAAILIARNLDPSDWGVFSAFLGLSFALAIFVEFGLSTWLLRELSRLFAEKGDDAEAEAKALMSPAIGSAVAATGLLVVIATAVAALFGEPLLTVLALSSLILYGGLFSTANVLESYLRARRRLRRVVGASILEKYVLVSLLLAAALSGTQVWQIGVIYVLAGVARVTVLERSVFGKTLPARPSLRDMRGVWRNSLPFALTSGAVSVVPNLDALFLLALSATAAGYFALGVRVLGPAVAIATIGATAMYPHLARRVHGPGTIWGLSACFCIFGGLLALIGILLAPVLVPAIFGSQYDEAVPAVRLMLLSLPFAYATNPLLAYGFSHGRERQVVRATVAATLIGTAAILGGQVVGGPSGAAGGLLIRQALLLLAFCWLALNVTSGRHVVHPLARAPSPQSPLS